MRLDGRTGSGDIVCKVSAASLSQAWCSEQKRSGGSTWSLSYPVPAQQAQAPTSRARTQLKRAALSASCPHGGQRCPAAPAPISPCTIVPPAASP